MDKDIMEHIDKYNAKRVTPEAFKNAMFLCEATGGLSIITQEAYKIGESEGTHVLSTVIIALIMVNSKNIDQSISRIDAIHTQIKKDLIKIDQEARQ